MKKEQQFVVAIIFGVYLGGLKHVPARGIYIAIEGVVALIIAWLIGRRKLFNENIPGWELLGVLSNSHK